MRILFLTHYFPPEGNAPATRVYELCRRWVKKGHQVTVITGVPNVPNGQVYEGYRNRLWQTEEMTGIHVVRVWTYLAPNKGTLRRIMNYLSFMVTSLAAGCFVQRPDVIIATSPQFFCGWAGALLSKLRRRAFILEIRDIWPESIEVVGAMKAGPLLRLLSWLERKLYASADHIVTVGEGYYKKLLERNVPAGKLSIVMNGVDAEYFESVPSGAEVRQSYGLNGDFVCSYVGTVGMACGLEVVVRAATVLKQSGVTNIKFLIVGDGALLADLERLIKSQELDNVLLAGRQPKQRILDFLAASDACLVHLKKQALFNTVMPSKIFEALAMARPVILGVEGFAADFIRKSGGGVCIEPENENDLIQAVKSLRDNHERAKAAGKKGREFVLKNYDRNRLAEHYLQIIGGLCP